MVSLEGLSKIVDPSQLTADFEGSLEYNHEDWIEVWNLLTLFFKNTQKLFFIIIIYFLFSVFNEENGPLLLRI